MIQILSLAIECLLRSLVPFMIMFLLFMGSVSCSLNAKMKPRLIHLDPVKAGVVAKIGNQEITEAELVGTDQIDFYELKKREFDLKMERVHRLLVDKLLGQEAKALNLSIDQFVDQKLGGAKIKITDKEILSFAAEKKIPEAQMNDQLKEKIKNYLEMVKKQELIGNEVAKLTQKEPIEIYFKRPRLDAQVAVGTAATFGTPTAPVTIVEFSDFQCPYCSKAADTVTQLRKKYGSRIHFAFKHFPLPNHPDAKVASEAALCVNEQGVDKFWKFHDAVFADQAHLDLDSLEKAAKASGVKLEDYQSCVKDKKYAAAVQADVEQGQKVGIRSTPSFFINGQLISGALPIENFAELIEEEIEESKNASKKQ